MSESTILQSERLVQNYYSTEDFNTMIDILTDEEIMAFVLNGPIKKSDFNYFIKTHFAEFPNYIGLGVLKLKKSEEIIGFSGMHKLYFGDEEKVEIGFVIKTSFQIKGYGFEIGSSLLKYLKSLGYIEAFATAHPKNINSISLIENKLLMQRVPIQKVFDDRGERIIFKKCL